jgi:hypothetical protein
VDHQLVLLRDETKEQKEAIMSEEKGTYLGTQEPDDQKYQIRDEATPRDFFAQIPNLADIMELSPHAYRLYGHIRKVAGENGKCWQSTKTLAVSCGMSTGKVSEAKAELESVYPPLIRIEDKIFEQGKYHEITVTDVWGINHAFWMGENATVKTAKGAVFHNMNEWRSYYEQGCSQYETKKNPIQEEPKSGADAPKIDEMSLEWQIGSGVRTVTITDTDTAQRRDSANLIGTGLGINAQAGAELAFAFQDERGITFTHGDVKGQRKAVKYLLEKKVKPDHVREAVRKLTAINFTCTDLFSITDTAVDLANQPEKPKEPERPEHKPYQPKEGNYVPRPKHLKPNLAG